MTYFPETEYAHCPHCGAHEGMGLVSEHGYAFVMCLCGARGPRVERAQFKNGMSFDIRAMDAATRAAWNHRAGSNGLAELQAKVNDCVQRMRCAREAYGSVSEGFFTELEKWSDLLSAAQAAIAPTMP